MSAFIVPPTFTDGYFRKNRPEEQQLYDHLFYCVQTESPNDLIQRFQNLLLNTENYPDSEVRTALEKITTSKEAEKEFPAILNRCCHILINRWQMQPDLRWAIPVLVRILENPPSAGAAGRHTTRGTRQLRQLVEDFVHTDQYLTLQRLKRVIEAEQNQNNVSSEEPIIIGNVINRYPFLHEHCLLSEDSSYEHQQTVRNIQYNLQHKFEIHLSQYVTYQIRLAQLSRQQRSQAKTSQRLKPIANPTLMRDRELAASLKHFMGKIQGNYTYHDLAQNFLAHIQHIPSYKAFKEDFYEYLISSISSDYGKRQFNERLYKYIQNILPHCDKQSPTEFLILRTASQVLNFLVIESRQRPHHYVFVDLVTHLGATETVGLLLKVVLVCRKVKPYVEKRFSILFAHYETSTRQEVPWLVKSFDNLQVAFSVYFGSVDLSYLKQLMN